jgi:hypothetical protein
MLTASSFAFPPKPANAPNAARSDLETLAGKARTPPQTPPSEAIIPTCRKRPRLLWRRHPAAFRAVGDESGECGEPSSNSRTQPSPKPAAWQARC